MKVLKLIKLFVPVMCFTSSYAQSFVDGSFESYNSGSGFCGLTGDNLQAFILNGNTTDYASFGNGAVCLTNGAQSFGYSGSCPGLSPTPSTGNYDIGVGKNAAFALKLSALLVPGQCYSITFKINNKNDDGSGSPCNYPAKLEFGVSNSPSSFGTSVVTMTNDVAPSSTWNQYSVVFTAPAGNNNYICLRLADQTDNNAFLYADDFSINSSPCTLPVNLISFEASLTGDCRLLTRWTTAFENNTDRFELEKSIDGRIFNLFTIIKANGHPDDYSNLSVLNNQAPRKYYLRLKMIDADGKFVYSPIVKVVSNCNSDKGGNKFMVSVNPVHRNGYLTIHSSVSETVLLAISSISGKMIHSQKRSFVASANQLLLPAVITQQGTYILKITRANEDSETFKLVIF